MFKQFSTYRPNFWLILSDAAFYCRAQFRSEHGYGPIIWQESFSGLSNKAINNGLACSVLLLSTTGLFLARRKTLEHETQSNALKFFQVLETILDCSKTVLSTLNQCLLRLDNFQKCQFSLRILSTSKNQSDCENLARNCPNHFGKLFPVKKLRTYHLMGSLAFDE